MLNFRRAALSIVVAMPLLGVGCAATSGAFTNVDYRVARREEDGVPALMFLADFRVRGVKSEQVKLEVTLLDKRGTPLQAAQRRYSNRAGAIAAGKTLPVFDGRGDYERVVVSLPIEELRGVGRNRPETARFSVYDIAGGKLISEDLTIQLRGADLRRMLDEQGSDDPGADAPFAEAPPSDVPATDAAPADFPATGSTYADAAAARDGGEFPFTPGPPETPDYAFERQPARPTRPAAVPDEPASEQTLPAFDTPPSPANEAPPAGWSSNSKPTPSDSSPGNMEETWGSDQRVPLEEVVETAKRGEQWVPPSDAGRAPPMPPPPPAPTEGESTVTPIRVLPPEADSGDSSNRNGAPPVAPREAGEARNSPRSDGLVPVSDWSNERVAPPPANAEPRNASPANNATMNGSEDAGLVPIGAASAAPDPREYRFYTVKAGDSLTAIAQKMLGSSKRWRDIYRLNRGRLESPDYLPEGLRLRVPAK